MPLRTSLTVWILSAALFFCGAAVLYGIPRPKAPPPGQAGVWSEAQRPSDPPRRSAVPPGTFAWRTLKAVAAPVVGNVIIYDYGTVACIVNPGAADIPEPVLPDQQPDWVILVEQPVDSVWWDPQRRQLRRRIGCLDRVTCYPDYDVEPHPVAVPYHSCSIGKADMHSSGYEGCTAVVLFNGETCAYAHCLSSEGQDGEPYPDHYFTIYNFMAHLGPVLEETGGTWRGFVAGPEEARARVALTLEAAGIPLVQSLEMDRSGHAAYFTRKTGELILIPTDAILD